MKLFKFITIKANKIIVFQCNLLNCNNTRFLIEE